VSGDALIAIWKSDPIVWDSIEPYRLALKTKRRPSKHAIAIVDQALALCVIPSRGYADPTYEQILSRCPSISSIDTVKYSLQVLSDSGRWVTVRRSCRGQEGMPGRAPRRVFFRHDPMGLIGRIDLPKPEEKISQKRTPVSESRKEQVAPNFEEIHSRVREIKNEMVDWKKIIETGPRRGISYAESRFKSLQDELTREMLSFPTGS
jgi:hypothetical protein